MRDVVLAGDRFSEVGQWRSSVGWPDHLRHHRDSQSEGTLLTDNYARTTGIKEDCPTIGRTGSSYRGKVSVQNEKGLSNREPPLTV